MGNTTSEVASGVKAQVNSGGQGPELYRFADLTVNNSNTKTSVRKLKDFKLDSRVEEK